MSGNKETPKAERPNKASDQNKADLESEDSFPASDPPSTTPVAGSRKAEQNQTKTDKPG